MTAPKGRPGVGNRENRESSRWAASLLGRSRILFFDIWHVSSSSLKVGYTRSAFWHRSLCMGCTMRGSSPLPNRVGWVHSPSFPKTFLRLPIAGPALPQRYASEDGWEEEGLKKRGWKKERHWRRMLPNVPSLPIYFQEDKHKWQLVKRDIGLMISNVTIRLTL